MFGTGGLVGGVPKRENPRGPSQSKYAVTRETKTCNLTDRQRMDNACIKGSYLSIYPLSRL
jgi:hypothetical protein